MKSSHWLDHIERQRKSTQTVAAYCRQHDLNPQSFYKHRSLLRRRARASSAESLVKVELIPAEEQACSPMTVEVRIGVSMKLVSSEWPPAEVLKSYREVLG